MSHPSSVRIRVALVVPALAGLAVAQSYTNNTSQIPSGATFNSGYTENVDFGDIDNDGDRDLVKADGGDAGNDQSRLWVNKGFEAGGTIGFFADRTSTQFPVVLATSRDMDFVDIDRDGDLDIYVSNTSTANNQTNRWWINMGGAQGGTMGFFQDQTSTHWTFLGVNNGTTHFSSIAATTVLGSGGFTDWSCDCVFGDLDNDGDEDLYHSTYGGVFGGQVPSRIFLNDGNGFFEEFNPSHFQLTNTLINNGNPGLWCEGTQQHGTTNTTGTQCDIADTPLGAELGDLDGDLDIDVLQGARNEMPRFYRNRLVDTGSLAFRDVTFSAGYTGNVSGQNNYEQELGDFDNDDDLDLYGLNWPSLSDATFKNDGTGVFTIAQTLANSGGDDNEPDWFDFNNDGRLDEYTSAFAGRNRLYRNNGPATWNHTDVSASETPNIFEDSLGADTCDVDADGDYDVVVANDVDDPERFYKNGNQILDAIAPRVNHLEQAPNRAAGPAPTVVRLHVYDNASWDVTRYDTATIEFSCDGNLWYSSPLRFVGGQVFRGEIRGNITGNIQYRARVIDEHGNVGLSTTKSFIASGCASTVVTYCTAGTSTSGCVPVISGSGTPSATAPSGFTLTLTGVEGQKTGLFFFGINGRKATPWGGGSPSFLCVQAPTQRMGSQTSGGTAGACDGTFSEDWNTYMSTHLTALGQPLTGCVVVNAQCWYRDPPAPQTTNLSGGIEFNVCQ